MPSPAARGNFAPQVLTAFPRAGRPWENILCLLFQSALWSSATGGRRFYFILATRFTRHGVRRKGRRVINFPLATCHEKRCHRLAARVEYPLSVVSVWLIVCVLVRPILYSPEKKKSLLATRFARHEVRLEDRLYINFPRPTWSGKKCHRLAASRNFGKAMGV